MWANNTILLAANVKVHVSLWEGFVNLSKSKNAQYVDAFVLDCETCGWDLNVSLRLFKPWFFLEFNIWQRRNFKRDELHLNIIHREFDGSFAFPESSVLIFNLARLTTKKHV